MARCPWSGWPETSESEGVREAPVLWGRALHWGVRPLVQRLTRLWNHAVLATCRHCWLSASECPGGIAGRGQGRERGALVRAPGPSSTQGQMSPEGTVPASVGSSVAAQGQPC